MILRRARKRLRLFDDRVIRGSVGMIIRFLSIEHHEVTHRGRRRNLLLEHSLPVPRSIVDRRHEKPIRRERQHDPPPQPESLCFTQGHEIRTARSRADERLRIQPAQSLGNSLTNHLHTPERKSSRLRIRSVNPPPSKRNDRRTRTVTGTLLIRHLYPFGRHYECTFEAPIAATRQELCLFTAFTSTA